MLKLSYESMLYLLLGIISIIILYKLFSKNVQETLILNDDYYGIEGFESAIKKLKKQSKSQFSSISKSSKIKKSKLTFDDIVKEAEQMDPSRYTVDSLKKDFFSYISSFQKAKFENVSGTSNEALDKFSFFKDKFFEIFR